MDMVMVGNNGLALDMFAPPDGIRELADNKSEKVDIISGFLEYSNLRSSTFPMRSVVAREARCSDRPSSVRRSATQYKSPLHSALLDPHFQPFE